ncbi:MAG TPA: type I DNA topoisomerase [Aliidongia sp.]|uniref:type I DNA topoisomerase n=1 Tax=Aliidongia sp. TaxID=1914230 RepID=UPI002DDCA3F9|nr:type I DNA topoisomerase [Aliidongia sp.]HEV2676818.1 type I DNA topoisomerase [Aliidongia sp.]
MNVVVVESPAKAKTINKYLGDGYTVLASYGHVRDLPAKDGSVRPDEDFAMSWEVEDRAEKRVRDIVQALKGAKALFLATDPDREGEAISWHLAKVLDERKALKGIPVKRVVFNEVTKTAVLEAFQNARELNGELVDAYMARRALDYLVGFTLSPVLWRKLPGSRSAGRVQSVALRLICEREAEIEVFRPREYWSVESTFKTGPGATFSARLTHLDGQKLDKFDLANEAAATNAVDAVTSEPGYAVAKLEHRQVRRHPQPPFTTSTLQQEASRKLGFTTSRTMQIAQRLYEGIDLGGETVGLITYMRTDGVALSVDAVTAARRLIDRDYGPQYVPGAPRQYKAIAKNAQEAHEAIRPTDMFRHPSQVVSVLDSDQLRLYELIWKRTVACQMESAVMDQVTADINGASGRVTFRATGSVVRFDGFLKLYQEGRDDDADDDENRRLPPLSEREALNRLDVRPDQHFTEPPPRYTEASLVKKLEELGIGRPSTYSSIIQVLQDREYVVLEKKRFTPQDRGRLVTAFLENFFERYVQYSFTADLENLLDEISGGRADWKQVLRQFWDHFSLAVAGTKELTITQVLDALDTELGPHFFPEDGSGRDPRVCPSCAAGRLSLKLGKFGAFIGCSNYPECRFTRPLAVEGQGDGEAASPGDMGPRVLGNDPVTNLPVSVRKGPYGSYIQLGEAAVEGEKPKRVSLPKGMKPQDVLLEPALGLLSLPRDIGTHPETGDMIIAGIGKFGPYIKLGKTFKSISPDDDVLTIGINRAVSLLAEPSKGGRAAPTPLKTLGEHPVDQAPVQVFKGRYGPYVAHDGVYASLPRDADPETFPLDKALELLAVQKAKPKTGKSRSSSKAAPKKAAPKAKAAKAEDGTATAVAKKAPAKKAAPKKVAAKKPAAKKVASA